MRIEVRVQPRSSKEEVADLGGDRYKVYMHEPAVEGKANKRLIEMLAEHFGAKKSGIRIVSGLKSRNKVAEIG